MTSFEAPLQACELLSRITCPWFVAGGWAVDLFLGAETREHADLEVAVFRKDQLIVRDYLKGWAFVKAIPSSRGQTEPWSEDEWLELPVHEIHAQRSGAALEHIEFLLNEKHGSEWRFRKNLEIKRPIAFIGQRSKQGIPFLSPEVVLLYKANQPRGIDKADFEHVVPLLPKETASWLEQAIGACYPQHPWIARLQESHQARTPF